MSIALFIRIGLASGLRSLLLCILGIYIWNRRRDTRYDRLPEASRPTSLMRRLSERILGRMELQGDFPLCEMPGDWGVELPGLVVSRELPSGSVAAELGMREAERERLERLPRAMKSEFG